MLKDATMRLKHTVLFQELREREGDDHEVSEHVIKVVGQVTPLLDRIADKMPEYTLHDPNHSAKVAELMAQIIPEDTRKRLNVVELSILLYAAYLHDVGMTCSSQEREEIIKGDEFKRLFNSDEDRVKKFEKYQANGDHRAMSVLEDMVFTDYLRRKHVKRSADFINQHYQGDDAISWQGTPYQRLVRVVCDSHELPVSHLRNDLSTWPRNALVRNLRINAQYLALVLRLADILDLDTERTPKALLDFIDPQNPTSIIEWNKHRSMIGWEITPERIEFEAECTDAIYERALREFLEWIEIERRDSVALASSYRDDLAKIYRFDLTEPVTQDHIHSNGSYIYSDFRFALDHKRVLNLLMGERLYGDPTLALRELLQNAVDTVRHREAVEKQKGRPYTPEISVRLEGNKLTIADNGMGMDKHILENYFMQAGRSYYRSPEFRQKNIDIDAVSEFGIGILSVFMIAEGFTVESFHLPENPINPGEPIKIEVPKAYDYFIQRIGTTTNVGTVISLNLRLDNPFS